MVASMHTLYVENSIYSLHTPNRFTGNMSETIGREEKNEGKETKWKE